MLFHIKELFRYLITFQFFFNFALLSNPSLNHEKICASNHGSTIKFSVDLKNILIEAKIDDSDNLHDSLIKSVIEHGVVGLDEFKDDVSTKKLNSLKNRLTELLKSNECEEISYVKTSFHKFIYELLEDFNVNKTDNFYTKFTNLAVKNVLEALEDFANEIQPPIKYRYLKDSLKLGKYFEISANCGSSDFRTFFKYLFKFKKIKDSESLWKKIGDLATEIILEISTAFEETKSNKGLQDSIKLARENSFASNSLNNLQQMRDSFISLPTCAEKFLQSLIFYINLKISHSDSSLIDSIDLKSIDEIIENEFKSLKERLIVEELDTKYSIEVFWPNKDLKSVLIELESILKQMRPLNIKKLSNIIASARNNSKLIYKQDIYLFIGSTGAGKTTMINFLAGSEMKMSRVEIKRGVFLQHIDVSPDQIAKNPSLKIGFETKSETQYINAIPVNLKDIGASYDENVILCDTPGFDDTGGPEVDIANSVSTVEAIKECNSVKPVILSSYKSIGDKGEGIKKLAHLLTRMIRNIEDKLSTFYYIFTKYPADVDIHASLVNIFNSVQNDPSEKNDKQFISILKDMQDKAKIGKLRIDPLNDSPLNVLKEMAKYESIDDPKRAFEFSITENSQKAINEQINGMQLSIYSALKRDDFDLISYKLKELKELNGFLKTPFIEMKYQECVRHVSTHYEKKLNDVFSIINQILTNQNALTLVNIQEYKNRNQEYDRLSELKIVDVKISDSEVFVQNLKDQVNKIINKFKELDLNQIELLSNLDRTKLLTDLKTNLDNIKLITDYFKEVRPKYEDICELLIQKVLDFANKTDFNQTTIDFIQFASKLSLIQGFKEFSAKHIPKIDEIYQSTINTVLKLIKNTSQNTFKLLKTEKLMNEDVEKINNLLNILENAKETVHLQEFISQEELKSEYDSVILKIKSYFDIIAKKIQNILNSESINSFNEIELLVNEMDNMRRISGLDFITSDAYHKTLQTVIAYIHNNRRDTEQELELFRKQNANINYSKLQKFLLLIKNFQWIGRFSKGFEENLLKSIIEELIKNAERYQKDILDLEIDLKHYSNIEDAYKSIQSLEELRQFGNISSEILVPINVSFKIFEESLNKSFDYIQNIFNLKDISIDKRKVELENLESLKIEYKTLHPSKVYLKKQQYETYETLLKKIDELESNNKKYLKSYEIESSKISSEISKTTEIFTSYVKDEESFIKNAINNIKNFIGSSESEKEDILKHHGFADVTEVDRKLKELKKTFQTLITTKDEFVKNYEDQLKSLIEIKKTFNELINSKDASEEGKEFLIENGFKDINDLEKEIERKRTEINVNEEQGQKYTFKQLDFNLTEDSLNFLKNCKIIRIVKTKAQDMELKLKEYIKQYADSLQRDFKTELDKFNKNNLKNLDFLYSSVIHLNKRLLEIHESKNYGLASSMFSSAQRFKECNQDLSEYYIQIKEALEDDRDANKSKIYINISKALCGLDEIIEIKKQFCELHNNFLKKDREKYNEICKEILAHVENKKFQKAASKLSQISESPCPVSINIPEAITDSITELIKNTETSAIILESNFDKIKDVQSIVADLKTLDSAKTYLSSYLDVEMRQHMENELVNIQSIISKKIIRFLDNTEARIHANDFDQAEENRESLSRIRVILGNYCNSEEIIRKTEDIRKMLEGMLENVEKKYNNLQLEDYILDPPKIVLERLEKVQHRNVNYAKSLAKVEKLIRDNIRGILKTAKESREIERKDLLNKVKLTLSYLPERLRGILELEMKNIEDSIIKQENQTQDDYENVLESGNIKSLLQFMEKCSQDGVATIVRVIQDEVLKRTRSCKENTVHELSNDNVKSALDSSIKIFQYNEYFVKNISQVGLIYSEITSYLLKKYNKVLDTLNAFASLDNSQLAERSFDDFNKFIEFKNLVKDLNYSQDFVSEITKKISSLYELFSSYFIEYQSNYHQYLKEFNLQGIKETMNFMKKWNSLFVKIKKYATLHENNVNQDQSQTNSLFLTKILEAKLYHEMKDDLSFKLLNIKNEILNFELIVGYQSQRDENYIRLAQNFRALQNLEKLIDHINSDIYDTREFSEKVVPYLMHKFQESGKLANKLLNTYYQSKKDFDDIRVCYDNLLDAEKHLKNFDLNIKQVIEEINLTVNTKLKILQEEIQKPDSQIELVANNLIQMKTFADNLPSLNERINEIIDESLKVYKNKNTGTLILATLSGLLEQDPTGIGLSIISEHKIFKGEAVSMFNQETQRHDITYVLKDLQGDELNIDKLQESYEKFDELYKSVVKKYILQLESSRNQKEIIYELVSKIKSLPKKVGHTVDSIVWDSVVRGKIVSLTAHIFALWTIQNTEYYTEMKGTEKRETYLLTPHPGQVISIFRILGIGYVKVNSTFWDSAKKIAGYEESVDGLKNNLVQVGTGEGKSLILAVTSSVLALLGIDVSCASYSAYLSSRDYESFLTMFESLGLTEHIHYGTFDKLCEKIINENGDIRSRVLDLILHESKSPIKLDEHYKRPKVLLIDEVDVFFSKDFYGNTYNPIAVLKHPTITNLVNFIWSNQKTGLSSKRLEATPEYQACINQFKGWEFIIKEAVKDMLADLKDYAHEYVVKNDKIFYNKQDSIANNIVYGYKTMFSYFYENQKDKISRSSLDESIFIIINCGSFSYAEIPSRFKFIMGVTGTLKTLSTSERNIVEGEYQIRKNTYMPSVFGENKRQFAKEADLYIENKDNYFIRLKEKIDYAIGSKKQKRAVLIFFETKKALMDFYDSKHLEPLKSEVQIITEEVALSPKEKDMMIKRATTSGQITLLTRIFGRGTDFVVRDHSVIANGGVHVIQTFYSEELSEEIQIMGRTARQGKDGSYEMILLDSDLEKYLGTSYIKEIEEMRKNKNTYDILNQKRNEFFGKKYSDIDEYVKKAYEEHELGRNFLDYLNNNEIELIKEFLGSRNKGATGSYISRTLCLMDATGSMTHLLNQAKNTVKTMFERASIVLEEHKIPGNSFQMQFAVYRDYDAPIEEIVQYSSWESKPENLKNFMDSIDSKYGDGDIPEAIEIALRHVNNENQKNPITQVIMIGDAPAKSKEAIYYTKNHYHGLSYWANSIYKDVIDYKNELEKLNVEGISVHTFYLSKYAKENFQEISAFTGGKSEALDIFSAAGSELLTQIVTEQILENIADLKGLQADVLVKSYRNKFVSGHL